MYTAVGAANVIYYDGVYIEHSLGHIALRSWFYNQLVYFFYWTHYSPSSADQNPWHVKLSWQTHRRSMLKRLKSDFTWKVNVRRARNSQQHIWRYVSFSTIAERMGFSMCQVSPLTWQSPCRSLWRNLKCSISWTSNLFHGETGSSAALMASTQHTTTRLSLWNKLLEDTSRWEM